MVLEIRKERPRTGTAKLYEKIKPLLQQENIKMGRSKLNNLLKYNTLLIKKTKRFHITTDIAVQPSRIMLKRMALL